VRPDEREFIVYQIGDSRMRHAVPRDAWERAGPVMSLCGKHCSPGFTLPPGSKVTCKRCWKAILAANGGSDA
jgi:hypothetical protein